ncbi:uncharacterized protein [Diadema antillarum]|uniref:uncharacterized protein n=1 Tax=Diadema antillarum TaxID=105358 RepID=UPI003A88ECFE
MRNLSKKDILEKETDNALNDTLFVKELDINKKDQVVSTDVLRSPYSAVYCATKFAMEGLTISSICPGAVTTNFVTNLSSNKASGEFAARANDPDSPSGKLMSSFLEMVPSHMKNTAQQAPDVADVVIECLREEQPKIRYGTSDYSRGRMSQKYADGVGGERAEEWYQLMSKLST